MSLVLKNKFNEIAWQPSASLDNLQTRAKILKTIRDFFTNRNVLEVDTPLMCHASVTNPYIESIPAIFQSAPQNQATHYYLQTSPEYAMKRLLAAGSGPIYQLCKAFRQGEIGRLHNPEFMMLEWYRPGFTHHDLMDEMDEFLKAILNTDAALRLSYAALFQHYLQIDPHEADLNTLKQLAEAHQIKVIGEVTDKDSWLDLLITHVIEPQLGRDRPCFIYDYPVTQAALARINPGSPKTAARFEVYFQGMELANGFHELQDANEQRKRFENNLVARQHLGLKTMVIDEFFLAALQYGLPDCAGVALGIDRLIMLATRSESIAEALSFDFSRV